MMPNIDKNVQDCGKRPKVVESGQEWPKGAKSGKKKKGGKKWRVGEVGEMLIFVHFFLLMFDFGGCIVSKKKL